MLSVTVTTIAPAKGSGVLLLLLLLLKLLKMLLSQLVVLVRGQISRKCCADVEPSLQYACSLLYEFANVVTLSMSLFPCLRGPIGQDRRR